jgi:DNA adenine methylase
MNIPKRPIMRWHGGKWRLAPWIISHFQAHRVYVEPFGGAGSVLLRKSRSYAEVYNDLDGEAVNLFRVVRDRGDELRELLELTPFARTEFIESYEPSSDPLEQARRTCARSFMGFGSNSHNRKTGFRSNSNRNGTTPAHDWANYPAALDAIIERLRGVVIECRDAKEVIAAHDSHETLIYVDPPYVAGTRDKGSDYKFEMSDSDHIDLAMFLSDAKGMVIVSGYESKIYDDIYRGWKKVTRAALADGARKRVEVLWINKAALSRLDNKQLALEARA